MRKRILSFILAFLMLFTALPLTALSASAASTAVVNGVTLPLKGFEAGKDVYANYNCWKFAQMVYGKLWPNKSFTNDQSTKDNLLKDVAMTDSARKATASNLKKFITQSAPGSVLRLSTSLSYVKAKSDNDMGHSMIIVSHNSTSFTVYDSTSSGIGFRTLTYENYANNWKINGKAVKNAYIKYIKAPTHNQPNTKDTIFNFLTEQIGLNEAAAVGFMANIQAESSFNPTNEYKESNGFVSYGLCQWNGSRKTALEKQAKNWGYASSSLTAQLMFIQYELTKNSYYNNNTYKKLLKVSNDLNGAKNAAEIVCRNYEVPANMNDAVKKRQGYAQTLWNTYGKNAAICTAPTVTTESVYGGLKVSISSKTSGATIYYTTDGSEPTDKSTKYTGAFTVGKTTTVKAVAVLSGYKNSSIATAKLTVGTVAKPTVSADVNQFRIHTTTADAAIYYTIDGSTPTMQSTLYQGNITLYENATIKALAVKKGCANSEIASYSFVASIPDGNVVFSETSPNVIGIGAITTTQWEPVKGATEYVIFVEKLSDNNQSETVYKTVTTDTCFSCTLSSYAQAGKESGTYRIGVSPSNYYGNCGATSRDVIVMPNVTVTYTDSVDGSVIAQQSIPYNGTAPEVPSFPARKGYKYTGWNPASTSLNNITADMTVQALATKEKYTVKFIDRNGNTVKEETVAFGNAATPPTDLSVPVGQTLATWTVVDGDGTDINAVDGNMELNPVFVWADKTMPLAIGNVSAVYANGTYTVTADIANRDNGATDNIRIATALKTKNNKLVEIEYHDIQNFTAGAQRQEVFKINSVNSGSVIEVYAFTYDNSKENGKTGGTLSAAVSANVVVEGNSYWSDWSDWSTTPISEDSTCKVETRTEYRSRDIQTLQSAQTSMDGWELLETKNETSYGNWSNWDINKKTASSSLEVQSKQMHYYMHWCNGGSGFAPSNKYTNGKYGPHYLLSETKLKQDRYSNSTGYWICDGEKKCTKGMASYYYMGQKTAYRSRSITTTTTYTYQKFGEWTQWDTTPIASTDHTQTDTRTVYRCKTLEPGTSQDFAKSENIQGTVHTVQGNLDVANNYTGYKALVMVYKQTNSDATEEQMQYIGQITLGENNSYDFSFIPKQELSENTGDFVVSIGIATADRQINNAYIIPAPVQQHTVTFKDENGALISMQTINDGENATLPTAPEKEGHIFVRWSESPVRINADMQITPVYMKSNKTVIFIDYANGKTVKTQEFAYGSTLQLPEEIPTAEGKTFTHWQTEDGTHVTNETTVTDTMVLSAHYETDMFTVTFLDANGNPLESIPVAYGEAAALLDIDNLPDASKANLIKDGFTFLGWSNETCWWKVTENISVKPILCESERSEPVQSNVEEGSYEGGIAVTLDVPNKTDGTKIFYTVDNSEPICITDNNGNLKPGNASTFEFVPESDDTIFLHENTTIKSISANMGNMESEICEFAYEVSNQEIKDSSLTSVNYSMPETYYQINETNANLCMTIVNPHADTITEYGYFLTNKITNENFAYNSEETALTQPSVGRVFTVTPLDSGTTYTYSFYAIIGGTYYESEEATFTTKGVAVLRGDINGDGKIEVADARLALRAAVNLETFTEQQKKAADADRSGELSVSDARLILRYAVGLEKW